MNFGGVRGGGGWVSEQGTVKGAWMGFMGIRASGCASKIPNQRRQLPLSVGESFSLHVFCIPIYTPTP